ncbi:ABC transporter substrate-binding protein [Sneathiella chungangensis]|uniref:ABC transporter substrate-binding protein n=1 Tax=Sneathiella chungangensis TaxID=1418234 RepID=A0A845MEM6_9PROT|nr:substrate-binding protein [Sneathiella chungangensis]MZR22428.1 ABC transporter substrate-binding protein [Sneathiella chungangensis]
MIDISRRHFMGAMGATVAASAIGMPAIAAGKTIKVGAVQPFSGGLELFGNQAKMGLDLAVAEINAAGGILGHDVEILYEDNKTDPKTSVEKAKKLIERDEVIAISGPITSAGRDAMAATMERGKTPLLYATNYEGGICNRYLFSFNTVPNQDTAPLIPYLKEEGIGDSYYMFGADYVWPRNMFKTAKGIIADIGGSTLGEEYTPFGVKDFAPIIRKIADSGAKILLFALPGADGITFIKQAEEFGLTKTMKIAFLGFAETYLGAFGPGKGEGMYAGVPMVASSPEPGVQDFVAKIRKAAGDDAVVSFYVMTHYNSLIALKGGIEKAGKVDREAAIDGMAGLSFTIPTGPAMITEDDHHTAMNMYIAKTEDGTLKVAKELGLIKPAPQCG